MNTPRSIKRLGASLLIGGQAVAATLRGRIDRLEQQLRQMNRPE